MNSEQTIPVIDSRLKLLSNSSSGLLHSCPRKYQLTKQWKESIWDESVDTSYGKMFGEGIQRLLVGHSLEEAWLYAISQWNMDIDDFKKRKTFWGCLAAIKDFHSFAGRLLLSEYEAVAFKGKWSNELSFCLNLGDGFYYRGYMDIVLRHKSSGRVLVVDVKTTNMNYSSPYKFQHSPQAIGYSVVLDFIAPDTHSYDVMYFEYSAELNKYFEHLFTIDFLQRAEWIKDVVVDTDLIKMYSNYSSWPKHGGYGCISFGKPCYFMDYCSMQTENILPNKPITMDALEYEQLTASRPISYDFNIDLADLIERQLEKTQ